MIDIQLGNLTPMVETGIACEIPSPAIPTVIEAELQEFCFCEWECEYLERVFALTGGTPFQNDKSAFARRRTLVADTLVFQLFKDGVLLATLVDDTYGEFFDFGDHPTQPDVKAFRIDWENVFTSEGGGQYQFKSVETIVGVTTTFESRKFRLQKYDVEAVDRTVRVEMIQNGSINGGPEDFDYTGMNWENSFRIQGRLGPKIPTVVNDFYENKKREKTQITTTIETSYKLTTLLIPKEVVDLLVYNVFLANEIFVTDYNIFSDHNLGKGGAIVYNRIEVDKGDIEEPTAFNRSQKQLYIVNFVDKVDVRKRNFE